MENQKAELDRLKSQFIKTERIYADEKACLMKVINTFGTVLDMHPAFTAEHRVIKKILKAGNDLRVDEIEAQIDNLRKKIFTMETETTVAAGKDGALNDGDEHLLNACRSIKKIMHPFLNGFYPLSAEMKAKADAITITCHARMAESDFDEPTKAFLDYAQSLKDKILSDSRYINRAFLTLLDHVKELEKMLTDEFGRQEQLKKIEHFEMNVKKEMGHIVNSFDVHSTINEIKSAVVKKLKKIKLLVVKNKEEEVKRTEKTQKKIHQLNERILAAEKDAQQMSKRAEQFQEVAIRDGLTGLYNRHAFDTKLKDALQLLKDEGPTFSSVLFDVDHFKWVNDTFGHVAGDKVLKVVANTLKQTFRESDFIARYGGDEFAVVIEGLSEEIAHKRIAKFSENFSKRRFVSKMVDDHVQIAVSAGVAVATPGESPGDLIHRADAAMYEIKRQRHSSRGSVTKKS